MGGCLKVGLSLARSLGIDGHMLHLAVLFGREAVRQVVGLF